VRLDSRCRVRWETVPGRRPQQRRVRFLADELGEVCGEHIGRACRERPRPDRRGSLRQVCADRPGLVKTSAVPDSEVIRHQGIDAVELRCSFR
jgi:hypothetical protein